MCLQIEGYSIREAITWGVLLYIEKKFDPDLQRYSQSRSIACSHQEWSPDSIPASGSPFTANGHFSIHRNCNSQSHGMARSHSAVTVLFTKPLAELFLALTGMIPVEQKKIP